MNCTYLYNVKSRSNSITLLAIISSIVLLLGLELFWLRMEYNNELSRFQRETHMLFRNTVFELNDSLLQKTLLKVDLTTPLRTSTDSTAQIKHGRMIQVLVDSTSNAHVLIAPANGEPVVPHQRNFMVRFKIDTLDHKVIEEKYREELHKVGIDQPVHLALLADDDADHSRFIFSESTIRTPSGIFKIEFDNIKWLILGNISPQILFSLALTLLVIGSFTLLYRNLLLQQRLVGIKDGLISNISHELKTPITTVGVALEGLKNFKGQFDSHTSREYLEIAENELRRLTMLTERVLNASLAENSQAILNKEWLDFSQLAEEVVQSFKLIADKKGASISISKSGHDFKVFGDKDHLSNMLFNLLDNGLKYSPNSPSLNITLTESQNKISCSIEDNGIGIPEAYHRKIFEKFFRVPTGDLHAVKGYGLGLSYVSQVIRSHNGSITVQSKAGTGSIFTVTLPKHGKK